MAGSRQTTLRLWNHLSHFFTFKISTFLSFQTKEQNSRFFEGTDLFKSSFKSYLNEVDLG